MSHFLSYQRLGAKADASPLASCHGFVMVAGILPYPLGINVPLRRSSTSAVSLIVEGP